MNLESYTKYLQYDLNRSGHTVDAYMRDLSEFIAFFTDNFQNINPVESNGAGNPTVAAMADVPATDVPIFDCTKVRGSHIRQWFAECTNNGIGPRSLRRKASSLSSYFRYLMLRGELKANPLAGIHLPKFTAPLPSFIKEKEIETLIISEQAQARLKSNQASTRREKIKAFEQMRDALIIEMLYSTGIRRAEITALTDADIDSSRKELKVAGKGNKERRLPLHSALIEKISAYIAVRNELLPNDCNALWRTGNGKPLNHDALYYIVKKRLRTTAALHQSPHTLRHSFATAMLNNGAEINTVKKFLGHAGINTTQIYTHVSPADLKLNYNRAHPRATNTKGGNHGN